MKIINKKVLITLVVALATYSGWLMASWSQAGELDTTPGTVDDPLVSKSYMDEQVEKLVVRELENLQKGFSQKLTDAITANQAQAKQDLAVELKKVRESTPTAQTDFEIVPVKLGQMLVLNSGAEAIVRQGRAQLYSPDSNGVSNITIGKALFNRDLLMNDHLLVFPREGRAILHHSNYRAELIVMVRGGYQTKPVVKP